MHNEPYVDRGIIKWAPFDALVGYHSMLEELRQRLGKKDRPLLSDDQYEELNRKLQLAYHQNLDIEVEFYRSGYLKSTFGKIRKLDWVKKMIILSSFEKISADDITQIDFTF